MTERSTLHRNSGLTLVEVSCALTIAMILSATVLSAFLALNRAIRAMTDHHSTRGAMRYSLTILADDIRRARSIAVDPAGTVVLTLDETNNARQTRYTVNDNFLKREDGGTVRVLCRGVACLKVEPVTREGKPVSVGDSVCMVRSTLFLLNRDRKVPTTNAFCIITAVRNTHQE